MNVAELIEKYFELNDEERLRFQILESLYLFWNDQINVISRKDTDQLYERHVLHSLGIANFIQFQPGTKVLDIGTGGGFPGIPLAIMFPDVQFTLVDSIGKKIKVVNAVKDELGLENVTAHHQRAEKVKGKFDFVVSRAVTKLKPQWSWINKKISAESFNILPNGFIGLKGGDLTDEVEEMHLDVEEVPLSEFFEESFFETKKIVYVAKP
ncbi:16S rRNA (guanine(527)-N(7))-methyltransferase RsmG [Salibacter halophilus]|uniref:Ribosomal RNA small subunit methyltransferase G n=1 Tax=Salibacter halophilus TaxID=1803916 RepID=A0A6N6M4I4_9FLAO|nr:16S rRNA (guanine(527)-N(7))-methyltransferase RsmG [Salibacter halophilus]KAB1062656.1 16S rRNA (guanine(527)-N(7))-methyltransferase RsmG [Salibacter halophilus]